MSESPNKLDQFFKKEGAAAAEDRRNRPSWRDNPVVIKNEEIKTNERLIKEMGIEPGVRVHLKLLDMSGVVKSVNKNSDVPIRVKREDGETFPYAIGDLEVIKN